MDSLDLFLVTDSLAGLGLLVLGTTLGFYALYCYLLPKPIPGIPYNYEAGRSILGDLPAMLRQGRTGSIFEWISDQAKRHPGPLCQIFMQPVGKPNLILSDYREAQDILRRRVNEWDRSDLSIQTLGGVLPNHHINKKTGPAWKANRRLLQDLMTPAFLHNVAAPNIYESVCDLIELWSLKARISNGRPFTALDDIYDAALDAVFEFTFGSAFPHRSLRPQLEFLRKIADERALRTLYDTVGEDDPVVFSRAATHETIQATFKMSQSIGEVFAFPRPWLGWFCKSFQPSETAASRVRHASAKEQVYKAVGRLQAQSKDGGDDWIKSAVDLMLSREAKFAAKEGRDPVYWSPTMRDEIVGFVLGGHDTTSTTMLWGLKFLTDSPKSQEKLRAALRAAHSNAVAESRAPSASEITNTPIAYLDAVTEEILRLAGTFPFTERQCKRDTTVLGHFVPKGTTMYLLSIGPTITEVGELVDEKLRSETSQKAFMEHGTRQWDAEGINEFRPERWLTGVNGADVFDSTAGPMLAFGNGVRWCFGRRLAYVEMRIMITMLVWHFELLQSSEKLSGYAAVDDLTRKPRECYVRLGNLQGK